MLQFLPGSRPLPINGNLLMMDQLTHRSLAKLADKYSGVCHVRVGFLDAFAISTPDMARQVVQVQDRVFSNHPTTIAITYLTYDRADVAFARTPIESWASIRDEADCHPPHHRWSHKRARLQPHQQHHLPGGVDQKEFIRILQEFSKFFGAFNIGDFIPWLSWMDVQGMNERLKVARQALDWLIDKIIE
ncbi:putative Cytochrome P450 84A1 [Cocos nucifera]|uniref:Putative Cytochrome P450 84A1 n=1 Tax=Cocos nucifera TaxID=13894 RepID=A0A8K0I257_COCNU|nr:putative Cytochrome P450 84A1 [Cocos nucifera]